MQTVRIKLSAIAMMLAFIVHHSDAQSSGRYTISGYVREEESGETLIGVNIYLPDMLTGTVTNNYGSCYWL